ncbi:hypothetical protein V8D89_012121 [Ganoderma adspersum]
MSACACKKCPRGLRFGSSPVLAALALGVQVIADSPRVTWASILVADRAAASALRSARTQPGQHLVRLFLQQVDALQHKRGSLRIRIVWAPGRPEDFIPGSMAREDALSAAQGSSSDLPHSLRPLLDLPASRTALLKQFSAQTLTEWKTLWDLNRYRGLSRQQCSILAQLRSGHAALNSYLAHINAADSPLCLACRTPETPEHFLLVCRRFARERYEMCVAIEGPLSLWSTLGDVKARAAVLDFVAATGRFGDAYRSPACS